MDYYLSSKLSSSNTTNKPRRRFSLGSSQPSVIMEPSDRLRLKDKIINNISKAIKSIQEMLYYQSKDPVMAGSVVGFTLCNEDWPCHKLCENLDHALLHGLKKVTHGYWQVVKQLSHKQMVKEIDVLTNVTTELGKGRAWLYASLNEGNLESYIRLLCASEKLLKKYYAKEALMLDEDRMNILLTHTSGLECVSFQLEYDVPYLDLTAYPPRSRTNSELEDSVRSISPLPYKNRSGSFLSEPETRASSTEPICHPTSDSDSASCASLDVHSHSDMGCNMKSSTISSDSGYHPDGLFSEGAKQHRLTPTEAIIRLQVGVPADNVSLCSTTSSGDPDRHKRLENIISAGDDEEDQTGSFQVIRLKSRKVASKSKKKKPHQAKNYLDKNVKKADNNMNSTNEETSDLTNEGGYLVNIADKIAFENDSATSSDTNDGNVRGSPANCDGQSDSKTGLAWITKFDSGIDICESAKSDDKPSPQSTYGSDNKQMQRPDSPHSPCDSVQGQMEGKLGEVSSVGNSGNLSHRSVAASSHVGGNQGALVSGTTSLNANNTQVSRQSNQVSNSHSHTSKNKGSSFDQQNKSSFGNTYDDRSTTKANDGSSRVKSKLEADDSFDVYSSSKLDGPNQSHSEHNVADEMMKNSSIQSATKLKDYMDYILQTPDSPPTESKDRLEVQEKEADLSLSLDNNTKLQLMLDIFTQEAEQLLKMFVTRENHPEGDSNVVYVLISDHCLYLLNYRRSTKKFMLQSMAMLQDLLFISTGINDQTLNIESRGKNNQKQRLWLTPGHQKLTLAIVSCLTEAVKAANELILPVKSRFSVESEVPLQNIALRKYITTELQCEAYDVTVSDYSLVFWEDMSSPVNQFQDADAAYKEGPLFLRSQDPLKAHVWKQVYIVLKNSMLCVSNKKTDPRPHSYLGLGGDQCVGCRLTSTADRTHCVELILAQGGSWFLASSSEAEISEWRHSLCLAVSRGTVENNTLSACVPCGSVLACNHLFLCHEDLHTKFYRTLGKAQLEDVTSIACEEDYCVVEFESQETGVLGNQWVLYFSSAEDLQRYKTAVSAAWKEIFQIELPFSPIKKLSLQRHCSAISDQLRQQLALQ